MDLEVEIIYIYTHPIHEHFIPPDARDHHFCFNTGMVISGVF